jgi:hypothetical protein
MVEERDEEKEFYFSTIAKLEDAHYLDEVLKSDKWEVMRRVWSAQRDLAQQQLNGANPDDKTSIIRWQIMIDFYDNVIPRSIEDYKRRGKEAYETAQERGWLSKVAIYLKQF